MNKLPTKIGVITDVHGNLPALKAILQRLQDLGASQIIHTGDVVDIGPQSRECLKLLIDSGVQLVLGNHDFAFFKDRATQHQYSKVTAQHKRYVFDSMQDMLDTQSLFAPQINLEINGVKFVFTHYAMLDEPLPTGYLWQEINHNPTPSSLDEMFSYLSCNAVFYGHKHEQSDVDGASTTYVNVGSVGCHKNNYAKGVPITVEEDGTWYYQRIHAPYDREQMKQTMLQGNLPDAEPIFKHYFDHHN
jgi:predicted phosphodiesterase